MIIPKNTTELQAKLKAAFNGEAKPKEPNDTAKRVLGSDMAKERAKRKALADELANEKTTAARKQEIIDGLQAQLETAQSELESHKEELEKVKPQAKRWSDFEHRERTKLLESFPPEERKDAKAIAESMDIETFRKFATKITGKSSANDEAKGKDGGKNWESIMSGDPEAAGKAIESDPAGYNSYMDSLNK